MNETDARIASLISCLGHYMTAGQNQDLSDIGAELSASQAREAELRERLVTANEAFAAMSDTRRNEVYQLEFKLEAAELREAELRKLLESKVPEEVLIEIVTQAHMAGQFNQSQRDPSYYEARVYYGQKQLEIRAALAQPKEPKQ